jgi:CheY-like chemotaxis protein
VTDTGVGIPADLLHHVFEPFFTTKAVGEGSGLGLAMVHGFVKQSGGHVLIYSEAGHGTTIKIYLPRFIQSDQAAAAPAARSLETPTATRAKEGETIVLVEDNNGVREYARGALEDLGYIVIEATNGEEALAALEDATRVDLLFTDVVLPAMTGRELSDRALQRRPGLRVLFTTGYTRNSIIHNGQLDHDVQLISKPYTQQGLGRKVRQVLESPNLEALEVSGGSIS